MSGAAATNASLAWLGGGTLAAGGGGMAAGAAMASGIAAAPTLAVGGVFLLAKGKDSLGKAERFAADADTALAKHHEAQTVLKAVRLEAQRANSLLEELTPPLVRESGWLDGAVPSETQWSSLDVEAQERVRRLTVLAVAVSGLVHTAVLDENGELTRAISIACDSAGSIVRGSVV